MASSEVDDLWSLLFSQIKFRTEKHKKTCMESRKLLYCKGENCERFTIGEASSIDKICLTNLVEPLKKFMEERRNMTGTWAIKVNNMFNRSLVQLMYFYGERGEEDHINPASVTTNLTAEIDETLGEQQRPYIKPLACFTDCHRGSLCMLQGNGGPHGLPTLRTYFRDCGVDNGHVIIEKDEEDRDVIMEMMKQDSDSHNNTWKEFFYSLLLLCLLGPIYVLFTITKVFLWQAIRLLKIMYKISVVFFYWWSIAAGIWFVYHINKE